MFKKKAKGKNKKSRKKKLKKLKKMMCPDNKKRGGYITK